MVKSMRKSTLETLNLGTVFDIFAGGRLPASPSDLVDQVFGHSGRRGSLVISGANGIVGAGKSMQLGSRLQPFDVPIVALDFPGVPDGIGRQYGGLKRAFGAEGAGRIMENIIKLNYGGARLPAELKKSDPRFLLEAIPEILNIKKAHYEIFRQSFPEIEIRSVTSGFPSSQLGVGITHPAFPHEINKIWEVVEPETSAISQLFWAIGMIPVPVSDHWSFVLDVLFCGLTLAGLRYHRAGNMPFWKIDKYVRKLMGPNPFRAHDVIGAKGANFLTWSCLHDLSEHYGGLFTPTSELDEHKDSGENWYPPNHFRPLVDWQMDEAEEEVFETWILGAVAQMTGLLLHEQRAHLSHINAIGELCAQFRSGVLATFRRLGRDSIVKTVEKYHGLHPEAAKKSWHPEAFDNMEDADWQQLYVNAEHNGEVGVISIGRESYNGDVDAELNRAIDWLKKEGIGRVILSGDFHLATQMVGADTGDFFPALENREIGAQISGGWSRTARRLQDEFSISVGFINGKRCLGGFLELLMHCHFQVAVEDADLGMPEVTLPVVPGMEGCHWPFRKCPKAQWPKLLQMLLDGRSVKARDSQGWLIDSAAPLEEAIQTAWRIVTDGDHGLKKRKLEEGAIKDIPQYSPPHSGDEGMEAAREAILKTIRESCAAPLAKALDIQTNHSADFMSGRFCQKGIIGTEYTKTVKI